MINHRKVSFLKSGIRIVGYFSLAGGLSNSDFLVGGVIILVLAEVLGIFEELV